MAIQFSINPEKVRVDICDKLIQYQEECFTVLHDYWNKVFADNPRKKTTVDERTPLRDAVNMLVGKKGLLYDDAYNMVHQRFAIDSIDELSLEQIPLAVEYVYRVVLEGEFIGKQQEVSFSPQCSDEELVNLAWMWDYANRSQALFKEALPGMKQMKSGYAGTFHDHAIEFSYMLNVCRKIIDGMTSHIKVNKESVNTNPTVLIRLRANALPARNQ